MYRRINVKPLGEEWEPLYTGEQLPELQPQLNAMEIFRGGIPSDESFEEEAEEEVDTT